MTQRVVNREALDVLSYQDLDAFEDDLERLTLQERVVMSGAVVPFSPADINRASTECLDL